MKELLVCNANDVQFVFDGDVCVKANMLTDAELRPEYHNDALKVGGVSLKLISELTAKQVKSVKKKFADYADDIENYQEE